MSPFLKSLPILLAIIGFGVLLRVFALTSYGVERLDFGDAQDYLTTARIVCEGQPYPERGTLPFFRAPGFPFFLAATTLCELDSPVLAKAMVLLADGLTIGLIGLLAGCLWRTNATVLIAAGLAAIHPFFIVQSVDLRSEPVFTIFFLMALLGLLGKSRAYR